MSILFQRLISIGLISLGILISLWGGSHYFNGQGLSHPEQLAQAWERDLSRLQGAQALPPQWESLKSLEWNPATPVAQTWLTHMEDLNILPPSLPQLSSEGCCHLRLLLIGWDDEVQAGAIIQYSLIDLDSGNLLWELGRTFVLQERQSLLESPTSE